MLTRTRVSSTPRHRDTLPKGRLKKALSVLASGALIIGMGVSGALFAAAPAQAAPVNLGTVEAQVSNHRGDAGSTGQNAGTTSGYCIRYSPPNSSSETGPSNWVASGSEALTAHGRGGSNCPNNLSTSTQSAIGVQPAAGSLAPEPGAAFNIGKITHYNNPINYSGSSDYFKGTVSYRLPSLSKQFDFNWWMWETPNNGNDNQNRDQFKFLNQASDTTISVGGVDYKLVILGFRTVSNGAACPADPGSAVNEWLTYEGQQTQACLYGKLAQVRKLTVKKVVVGAGAPDTTFNFAPTSNLDGSPWKNSFALKGGQSKTADAVQGETITIAENAVADAQWSLTGVACVDSANQPIGTPNLGSRNVTLTNIPASANSDITCTFTNTYATKAKLTLKKIVASGTANKNSWTLSANTGGGAAELSGNDQGSGVSNANLSAGTYALAESGGPGGYTQQGNWVCTNDGNGSSVTVTNGSVDLVDKASVTCIVTNRYQTGSLEVKKVITDASGFSGTASTPFTGTWSCTVAGQGVVQSGNYTVSTGTSQTVSTTLPAGAECTVTENGPSGNLKNGSYEWVQYATDGPKTIVDNQKTTITVTNSTKQNTGTFTVEKKVSPADANTPAGGYTGGTGRQFTVHYVCTLGGQTISEGDLQVTPGTPVSGPTLPTSTSCALTEPAFSAKAGDFADASYEWAGRTVLPNVVTIPKGVDATVDSTVTNTFVRNFTKLDVKKVVTGAGYTSTGDDFKVNVVCGSTTTPLTLKNGETETVQNIPVGSLCTVQEVTPITAPLDAGHEWGAPTYAPGTQVTVVKGETKLVTVTNTTVPVYGQVSVTKATEGGGIAADKAFDVTVTCGAKTYNASIKAGETYTTPAGELLAGTECTVHEGAVSGGLVDDSYAWAATPVANDLKVTVAKNETKNVVLTNTTKRVYGSLVITKDLVDPDGVYSGPGFSGTYTCTDGKSGNWGPLADGGQATVTGILLGSSCTVTETAPAAPAPGDGSYVWAGIDYAPGTQVTLSAATPNPGVTVTNTVVRQSGSFAVSKTVQGDAAGYNADVPFGFDWVCTDDSSQEYSGSFDVLAGAAGGPGENIPAGSDCTVTEHDAPAPASGYTWDGVTLTATPGGSPQDGRSVSFTIPAPQNGDPVTVQVSAINALSKKYGSVEITKVVEGDGYTGGADQEFEASVACGVNGTEQVTFTTGGSDPLELPLGSECTVTEVTPVGGLADGSWAWDGVTVSPETFTITEPGQQIDVTITNTLKRVYGSVTLEKTLSGPSGVVDPDREYSGTWQCTHDGDAPVNGDWTTTAGASAITLSDEVLVDSDCVVLGEDLSQKPSNDPSYTWGDPVFTGDTVGAAEPALLVVGNSFSRETGKIEVLKAVTGDTEGYVAQAAGGTDFPINYDCSVDGVAGHLMGTVNVADGQKTVLVDGVPLGWSCELSEGQLDPDTLKDASYSWGAATVSPDKVTLGSNGETKLVNVTNPISQAFGTFTVTKQLDQVPGKVVADGTGYTGTWSCTYDGDVVASGDWQIDDASGGTTEAFGPVPLTSECSITEDAPSDGDLATGWSWNTPAIADPVEIVSSDVVPTAEVTNSVSQLWGALELTKVAEGDTAGIPAGLDVTGSWTCDWVDGEGDDAQAGGQWTVPATGGTVSLFTAAQKKVPVGADCQVQEDTLDNGELKDPSYAWATPDNGETVTLVDGQTAGITVTNTVERVRGTVIIDKVVTGPAKDLVDGATPFTGTLSCVYGDDPAVEYEWTATPDGNATVTGVLATSDCTAVETAPTSGPVPTDPSYQWVEVVGYDGNPATVPAAGDDWPVITVTNDTFRLKGDFTIEKVVSGSDAALEGVDPDASYTFEYSCVLPEGGDPVTGELTATATSPANLPKGVDLPAGTECTVTEPVDGLPGLKDDAYSWGDVSYTSSDAGASTEGRSITFTIAGKGAEELGHVLVTATNPITKTPGAFTTSKTSNPVSGSTVKPGDTITYTVTVTPTGQVTVHDIVAVDDLSGVLGKAVLDEDGITASVGTFAFDDATQKLTWNVGDLAANAGPQTLVYSVKVNADAWDATIGNSVTAGGDVPSDECTPEEPCTTDHHTDPEPAHLTLVKEVDNSAFAGKLGEGQVPGKPADWRLRLLGDGSSVFHGLGGSADILDREVKPGAYTLLETLDNETNPLLGFYSPGDWSCVGEGVSLSEGVLTLDPGADGTCTILNTAKTVDLSIDKHHVEQNDGGDWLVPTDEDASYPYSITVKNNTPNLVVPNVVVKDELPATLKAAPVAEWTVPAGWTATLTGASADGFGGTATFTKDASWTPEEAQSAEFGFLVTTAATLPREGGSDTGKILDIVNTATVTSGGVEGTPDDNTSTEETPVKSIEVNALAMCIANAPWVTYDLTPYNIENVELPRIVMIWWTPEAYAARNPDIPASDIDGILADGAAKVDEIVPPADAQSGVTITGQKLWPGAAVDSAGNGIAWPGWRLLPNGRWVLDPSAPFYELRGNAVVEIRMNPSTDAVEAYPPATPDCNAAPTQPKPITPGGMASTGFDPSWGIWGAAILVIGGVGLLLIIRRRRTAE
ncbi:DUF5979 domain-containing protein [Agromyces soli]|uniref:Isopeptide-forming domain-containing fimbrial protein n=1 Tax=Agromyces soli TaxID=659012 RepID=A0ABY4ASI7_9MICO|nr:DUF5979 domain-containing protein [Agromyces soli]UOE26093.1 isopeptide-forming domain-containing fimbrial protein [Agromyces soli]